MKRKKQRPVKRGSAAHRQLHKLWPILTFLIEKYKPRCSFCHQLLTIDDIFLFTIHHVNQDREDNSIGNREPSHRKCHKAYHIKYTTDLTAVLKEVGE